MDKGISKKQRDALEILKDFNFIKSIVEDNLDFSFKQVYRLKVVKFTPKKGLV